MGGKAAKGHKNRVVIIRLFRKKKEEEEKEKKKKQNKTMSERIIQRLTFFNLPSLWEFYI